MWQSFDFRGSCYYCRVYEDWYDVLQDHVMNDFWTQQARTENHQQANTVSHNTIHKENRKFSSFSNMIVHEVCKRKPWYLNCKHLIESTTRWLHTGKQESRLSNTNTFWFQIFWKVKETRQFVCNQAETRCLFLKKETFQIDDICNS